MVFNSVLYDVFCYLDATELDFMEQVNSQFKALRLHYFSKFPMDSVEVLQINVRKRTLQIVEDMQIDDTTESQIVQTIVEFKINNMVQFARDIETRYHLNTSILEINLKLGKLCLSRGILIQHSKDEFSFAWHFIRLDVCKKLKTKYLENDYPVISAICEILSRPYTAEGTKSVRDAYGVVCSKKLVDEELQRVPDISYAKELYSIGMI
uniref:F-box domain-containing protein n=1 Tax=Ditylenchus dipsaci TaxID=166011 RepID=A0A915D3T4_9BILA